MGLAAQHPAYVVGFQDEVWWSRVTQPSLHAWTQGAGSLHLVEQTVAANDPDPKALACYGLLVSCPAVPESLPEQIWLRFVAGRPMSALTTHYLEWCCAKLQQLGKTALILIWDNASWHISKAVRTWIRTHNRTVKQQGRGVRIVAFSLPTKSPWLNRIEPHWVHGKRAIVEPARLLTAQELAHRVCAYFGCDHEPHLAITENVA
jgi:hypothetical protein